MTSEHDVLGMWDRAMMAAGVPSHAALMWLAVAVFTSDSVRTADAPLRSAPEDVAEFALTCHELQIPANEGIGWYQEGVDLRHLSAYVKRGRSVADLRKIRIAVAREMKVPERRSRCPKFQEVIDWMLCPLPITVVVACVRAGLHPFEVPSVASATDDPLPALEMLAALRGSIHDGVPTELGPVRVGDIR